MSQQKVYNILTPEVKQTIWQLNQERVSCSDIARRLNVNCKTVWSFLHKLEQKKPAVPQTADDSLLQFIKTFFPFAPARTQRTLSDICQGAMESQRFQPAEIARCRAAQEGKEMKKTSNELKRIYRLLHNEKLFTKFAFIQYATKVLDLLENRDHLTIAMDWTDFDRDDQTTLMISLVLEDKSSIPLLFETVRKSTLAGKKNKVVDSLLRDLRKCLDGSRVPERKVCVVADREFGVVRLVSLLESLNFFYCLRIRTNILVGKEGKQRKVTAWMRGSKSKGNAGSTVTLRNVLFTRKNKQIPTVVMHGNTAMKDIWALLSNLPKLSSEDALKASDVLDLYAKRWSIESSFRNLKNLNVGLGFSQTRCETGAVRNRMWLIASIVFFFLTGLGKASRQLKLDRYVEINSSRSSFHLFKLGKAIFRYFFRREKSAIRDSLFCQCLSFCLNISLHLNFRNPFLQSDGG